MESSDLDPHDHQAYGVIFCGPPGQFSTWTITPDGQLMNRAAVEMLGQIAVRAGAVDYRTFPLDDTNAIDHKMPTEHFLSRDGAHRYTRLFTEGSGLPPSSPAGT